MSGYDPNSGVDIPWFERNELSKLENLPTKYKEAGESLQSNGYTKWK